MSTLSELDLRALSLSAPDYHSAPFREPPGKDTTPEDMERAVLESFEQLEVGRLISGDEHALLKQCLAYLKSGDEDSIEKLHNRLSSDQESSSVAVAIAGVAFSSIRNLSTITGERASRAEVGAQRTSRARWREIAWIALWDLAGAAGGAVIGGKIGGIAGAVIGALVVGAAFSLAAAYDGGLIP